MDIWAQKTDYVPGALVKPATVPVITPPTLSNPDFENGATGWDMSGNAIIAQDTDTYDGGWIAKCDGQVTGGGINQAFLECTPGNEATIKCHSSYAGSGETAFLAFTFYWYQSDKATLVDQKTMPQHQLTNAWQAYSDSMKAPAGAVYLKIGWTLTNQTTTTSLVDVFECDTGYVQPPFDLVYQWSTPDGELGTSGDVEPTWPTAFGGTVGDGGGTWTAVYPNRVTWESEALMVSGANEPALPAQVGATVRDNTIDWKATSQRILDKNCPNTKAVAAINSKIYAVDNDIIRYCATVNPLDWTTLGDAGYIPFGLQKYGSNPCEALGLYRGNLGAFNAEGFQMWQTDTDPANIQLLDALPIGTSYHHAMAPVANDLAILTKEGIRTVATAAAADSMKSGQTGEPIDELVLDALKSDAEPHGYYDPGLGQYLLAFNNYPAAGKATVFVYMTATKAFSYYEFPWTVSSFTNVDGVVTFRAGDNIMQFDPAAADDDGTPVDGVVQWQYLDLGAPGLLKQLVGLDVICEGQPTVSIGYDSSDVTKYQAVGKLPANTQPGAPVPLQNVVSEASLKMEFTGTAWRVYGAKLYFNIFGGRS